jgi:hypothetical protein
VNAQGEGWSQQQETILKAAAHESYKRSKE